VTVDDWEFSTVARWAFSVVVLRAEKLVAWMVFAKVDLSASVGMVGWTVSMMAFPMAESLDSQLGIRLVSVQGDGTDLH
jgi:hypothetical protein